MRAFELVTARDSRHAVALLAEHGASARILAGGTDLLVELKSASHAPQFIVDISRAEDLKIIAITDEGLSIGALVTHTEIMRSPRIRELFPALVDAAHTIGAVQTRNLGTLGGNLVTSVPSMDSGPTLIALDARITIAGTAGRRQSCSPSPRARPARKSNRPRPPRTSKACRGGSLSRPTKTPPPSQRLMTRAGNIPQMSGERMISV